MQLIVVKSKRNANTLNRTCIYVDFELIKTLKIVITHHQIFKNFCT